MPNIGDRHLHFNLDNKKQKTCFNFLKLLKKSSTPFISDLVYTYLIMNNILDISSLTSEDAKEIAKGVAYKFQTPENFASQSNALALQTMLSLMSVGLNNGSQPLTFPNLVHGGLDDNNIEPPDGITKASNLNTENSDYKEDESGGNNKENNFDQHDTHSDHSDSKSQDASEISHNILQDKYIDDEDDDFENEDDDNNEDYINPALANSLDLFK